jgi:tRNA A-37 threonylcarbamoyl transferase component Bud32
LNSENQGTNVEVRVSSAVSGFNRISSFGFPARRTALFVRNERLLQENGFTCFDDFFSCDRGEVVNSHATLRSGLLRSTSAGREVRRIEMRSQGAGCTVFLKRSGPSQCKDALKDLLRLRRVRTRSLVEFEMLCAFRDAGFSVPEVLAAGERHVFGRDTRSFVIVKSLGSALTLDKVLAACQDEAARMRLIRSTAQFVRRLHEAGLSHGELFAKHVFVEELPARASQGSSNAWSISVIDLQQAEQSKTVPALRRRRDLGALLISFAPRETTMRERLAFLREYLERPRLGREDLAFARDVIVPCARKLARRDDYKAWRPVLRGIRS